MQQSPVFFCGYSPGSIECLKCPVKLNCPNKEIEQQQSRQQDRRCS
jgi:hypothetical protein